MKFKVYGKRAMFTDIMHKVDKFSYDIPTYEAMKGLVKSIYSKPTFITVINEVVVMNLIERQVESINIINTSKNANDRTFYSYIKNPYYLVDMDFEWDLSHPELKQDRNRRKHEEIFKRYIKAGGNFNPFFGCSECVAYVEPLTDEEYETLKKESAYYGSGKIDFGGMMYHGLTYPNENEEHDLIRNFWFPIMENGVIKYPRPDDAIVKHQIIKKGTKDYTPKEFRKNESITFAEDEEI